MVLQLDKVSNADIALKHANDLDWVKNSLINWIFKDGMVDREGAQLYEFYRYRDKMKIAYDLDDEKFVAITDSYIDKNTPYYFRFSFANRPNSVINRVLDQNDSAFRDGDVLEGFWDNFDKLTKQISRKLANAIHENLELSLGLNNPDKDDYRKLLKDRKILPDDVPSDILGELVAENHISNSDNFVLIADKRFTKLFTTDTIFKGNYLIKFAKNRFDTYDAKETINKHPEIVDDLLNYINNDEYLTESFEYSGTKTEFLKVLINMLKLANLDESKRQTLFAKFFDLYCGSANPSIYNSEFKLIITALKDTEQIELLTNLPYVFKSRVLDLANVPLDNLTYYSQNLDYFLNSLGDELRYDFSENFVSLEKLNSLDLILSPNASEQIDKYIKLLHCLNELREMPKSVFELAEQLKQLPVKECDNVIEII